MEPVDFLIELSRVVGVADAVSVVSALKQDQLIWEYISGSNNFQTLLELAGGETQNWNPANLVMTILGLPHSDIKNFFAEPGNPLETTLQKKALAAYEDTLQKNQIPHTLSEVGLIALAMRERRRLTHNWVGLNQELLNKSQGSSKQSYLVWKTSLACVFGMIPDRSQFLLSLYSSQYDELTLAWIINIVLCYPLKVEEQALYIYPVLDGLATKNKILFIKKIRQQGRDELAKKLADHLIFNPDFLDVKFNIASQSIDQDALLSQSICANNNAYLYFLSCNMEKALSSLYTARRLTQNYLESIDIQIVGLNTGDNLSREIALSLSKLENTHSLSLSLEEELLFAVEPDSSNNLLNIREIEISNPLLIIKKAWLLAKDGGMGEAQKIALIAVQQLREDVQTHSFCDKSQYYPKYLMNWESHTIINYLIDLGLVTEALDFCLSLLGEYPVDKKLILETSYLFQMHGESVQAMRYAQLGVALGPEDPDCHRRLADIYVLQNNCSKAFDEWQKVLRYVDLPEPSDWLAFASSALNANQPQLAIDACKIVLEGNSENGVAFILLGQGLHAVGEINEAIQCLNKATSLMPEKEKSWILLAELYANLGKQNQVIDTLRSAVKVLPDSMDINYSLADACFAQGLTSEALVYSQKAYVLSPEVIDNTILHASILRSLGKLWESKDILSIGIEKFGKNVELAFIYGQVLLDLGESEYAIPFLKLAVDTTKPQKEKITLYASALINGENSILFPEEMINKTRLAEAREILDLAQVVSPNDFYVNLLVAEVNLVSGNYDSAFDQYKKLSGNPEAMTPEWKWRLQTGLGRLALKMGDATVALVSLQEAYAEKPTNIYILHLLAEAYLAANLLENAVDSAMNSRILSPEESGNLIWFSDFMVRCGRLQEAVDALEFLIIIEPKNYDLLIKLAKTQISIGLVKMAHQNLEKILKDKKLSPKTLQEIAHVMVILGDKDGALDCLERIGGEKIPETQKNVNLEIAFLLWELNKNDDAINVLKKKIAKDPTDVQSHTLLADIYVDSGKYQDAFAVMNQVIGGMPSDKIIDVILESLLGDMGWENSKKTMKSYQGKGEFYFRYSILCSKLGRYDEALIYAKKALEINPTHPVLRYFIIDLTMGSGDVRKIDELLPTLSEWLVEPISVQGSENFCKIAYLEMICQKIEINMGKSESVSVEELINAGRSIQTDYPRLLADQSSWYAVSGDWVNEANILQSYMTSLESRIPELNSNWYDIYLFKYDEDIYCRQWMANAYLVTQQWDRAFKVYDRYVDNHMLEPRGWVGYWNALQMAIGWGNIYKEIKSISHIPPELLIEEHQQKIFDSFNITHLNTDSLNIKKYVEKKLLDGDSQYRNPKYQLLNIKNILQLINNWTPVNADQVGDEIKRVATKRKTDPVYNVLFAIYYEKIENWGMALNLILAALNIWQNEPAWWVWASYLSNKNNQFVQGIKYLEKAVDLDPITLEYTLLLARANLEYGDIQKAIHYLEDIYLKYPNNIQIITTLSQVLMKSGQYPKALNLALNASEKDLSSPEALILCGEIALNMRKYDLALEYTRKAQTNFPLVPEVILLESKILVNIGKLEEALSILEKPVFEGSLAVTVERIRLTRKLRGDQRVLDMLVDAAKKYVDNIDILVLLAQVQLSCGLVVDACETAREVLYLQPENIPMNVLLARQCRRSGQLDQALYYFSTAINQSPADMEQYLEMGDIYRERRENLQAIHTYQKAISVIPDDYRPYFQAAIVLRESKDYPGAEVMLRKAVDLAPENLFIRKQLSAIIALNLIHNPQEVS